MKEFGSSTAADDLRGFYDALAGDQNTVKALKDKLLKAKTKKKPSTVSSDINRLNSKIKGKLRQGSALHRARKRLNLTSPKRTVIAMMRAVLNREETNFKACMSPRLLEKMHKEIARKGMNTFFDEAHRDFQRYGAFNPSKIVVTEDRVISATERKLYFKYAAKSSTARAKLVKSGRYWLIDNL